MLDDYASAVAGALPVAPSVIAGRRRGLSSWALAARQRLSSAWIGRRGMRIRFMGERCSVRVIMLVLMVMIVARR